MSSYLSIDLDYWLAQEESKFDFQEMFKFLRRLAKLKLNIAFACDHDQLFNHMLDNPADRLINIDYHSDLPGPKEAHRMNNAEDPMLWMFCGNWSALLSWAPQAEFSWIFPNWDCIDYGYGLCNLDGDSPFSKNPWPWKKIHKHRLDPFIPRDTVAIGICISYEYWNTDIVSRYAAGPFLKMLEASEVEYTAISGRRVLSLTPAEFLKLVDDWEEHVNQVQADIEACY
jgi:hypothetical protein